MNTLTYTNFKFKNQQNLYHGKVRDVYTIAPDILIMIATDRISAFDIILPRGIPHKGQILNQIASKFLDLTSDIIPNWKIASPDPMVTIGYKAEPIPVEMVVRGYLSGHAWREYKSGKRQICGVSLPNDLREHQKLPNPIITPTTKAKEGHDQDISREEILNSGLVPKEIYQKIEEYSLQLFARGTEIAAQQGLILVDTKYEFGLLNGQIILIDEIHTPDSSRYFYADQYLERFTKNEPQKQLSKEFVREWLMANNFQGQRGQSVPAMTDEFVHSVSCRYIELYETITGEKFIPHPTNQPIEDRIYKNIVDYLNSRFNQ
ncbi:MAG TPA: phosphoribosylaminoimidazolesuccinocarboxamide synthase [Salinivirgaceae bacterium]|nr:phosphoribosylaminoimidazolesuccinocarboxamide synthase [Salinivirgaceae bacterium]